ncbi:unnamed protein product, partial [Musa acuminata subsp. malaccensis]
MVISERERERERERVSCDCLIKDCSGKVEEHWRSGK